MKIKIILHYLIKLHPYAVTTCHQIIKREIDEVGYDWDAGVPHYEHIHYTQDGEIDFTPRIIGGTPAFPGEFPAKVWMIVKGSR